MVQQGETIQGMYLFFQKTCIIKFFVSLGLTARSKIPSKCVDEIFKIWKWADEFIFIKRAKCFLGLSLIVNTLRRLVQHELI